MQTTQFNALQNDANSYFETQLHFDLNALLAPISPGMPAGKWIRDSRAYRAIRNARSFDDDIAPSDAWEHALQDINWHSVSSKAADVLLRQSKDIECVGWLLEARLHIDGFGAIAPCLVLLDTLLITYWDTIYPLADSDGPYSRFNQIDWISAKLLFALHQMPMTANSGNSASTRYSWSDREQAQHTAQHMARYGGHQQLMPGPPPVAVQQGIAATATEHYQRLHHDLSAAIRALEALTKTLDSCFGDPAPRMATLPAVLEQMLAFIEDELRQRGEQPLPSIDGTPQPAFTQAKQAEQAALAACAGGIRDRDDAYAKLAELADYLMRLEPHNPVPHLLRRAVQWSKLDTGRLYHELFIRSNGTLSIAELFDGEASDRQA